MIIPVHFAGSCVDMEPIRALARDHDVAVIEDAAHAVGSQYHGQPVGRTGTSVFSFHPIKNLTTGEGGMVCSDDPDLLDQVKRLKFHGLGVDAFDRTMQGRSPQAQVLEPGYKYNMTDISAVLGLGQLGRLDAMNQRRKELAECYRTQLSGVEGILPLAEVTHCTRHAWHLYIVRVDTDRVGFNRDEFMARLKAQNIGTGLHFRAVHQQKFYAETLNLKPGSLPNTEWNSDRICSLPLCPDMTEEDVQDVVEAIKMVVGC